MAETDVHLLKEKNNKKIKLKVLNYGGISLPRFGKYLRF